MAKRERFSAPLQREKLEIQERIYNHHRRLLSSPAPFSPQPKDAVRVS
jgi:hypothetical protein